MALKRYAAKRDKNEGDIITTLRAVGATVQQISIKGCPDLLVGYHDQNFLLEVKGAKGKLTDDEQTWIDAWNGKVHIVRTEKEALQAIGILWMKEWNK